MDIRQLCSGVVFCAAFLGASVSHAQGRFEFDTAPGHLSKQVVPSRYALTLDLDPARETFTGRVSIVVRVRAQVPDIEVHAFELSAASARLVTAGAQRMLQVTPLPASRSWRLAPVDGLPVAPGEHRLEVEYSGKVNVAAEGLFVAPYEAGGRKLRMLAPRWPPKLLHLWPPQTPPP